MFGPTVSIVIPTRRRPESLCGCLDHILKGQLPNAIEALEVIVTDDDDDDKIARLLADRFPSVRWLPGPRRGPAANRNNGAAAAQGEWLVFTDDDCLPQPGWLVAFMQAARDGAAPVFEGRTTCQQGIPSPLFQAPVNLNGGYLWSCNMMVRRDVFHELGGFDERFPHAHMEDTDFRERLKAAGVPVVFVPQAVVDHPPRRIPWGSRRARFHECDVIYNHKWGLPIRSLSAHIVNEAKNRLRGLRHAPLSWATLSAFVSAIVELATVSMRYRGWVAHASRLPVEEGQH